MRPLTNSEIALAANSGSLTKELGDPVGYLLATSGKLLRSSITLHSSRAGTNVVPSQVRTAAIVVELVHLATLAHDDVLDDGALRRGVDTVSSAYGNLTAAHVGGVLVARACELIATCGAEATGMFAKTAAQMCMGQMTELEDAFDIARTVERYNLAIAGKTASLFELAAWCGGSLADAPDAAVSALRSYGREFGMAFQIADDILDITDSPSTTGKRRAKDLQHGIYTLPVIHAFGADDELSRRLAYAHDSLAIPEILERVIASGGIELAVHECQHRAGRAQASLEGPSMSESMDPLLAMTSHWIASLTERVFENAPVNR